MNPEWELKVGGAVDACNVFFRLATVVGKGVFYLEYRSYKIGF